MPDTADIEIRHTSFEDDIVIALSQRQREEILKTTPGLPPFATDIPVFIVLLRAGEVIACGGLRPLEDTAAEIKRVYVVPEARGKIQGVSDFLVKQLEQIALERGWTTIRLQTGITMVSANKFYERHGYRLTTNYGEYVDSTDTISYEKVLT